MAKRKKTPPNLVDLLGGKPETPESKPKDSLQVKPKVKPKVKPAKSPQPSGTSGPPAEKTEKPTGEVIQLINFRLRDEEFGVNIGSVREITRVAEITHIPEAPSFIQGVTNLRTRVAEITHIPEAPSFIQGVTNLRGQVIAVIDLAEQFRLPSQEELPGTARIVVTEFKGQTVGMLVDEVPGVLKITEEDIEPTPEKIQSEVSKDYIKGVGKLDNRLIILLDLEKVLAPHEAEELSALRKTETRDEG
ncbi:MAG: purine-binding chemotaxis protein CheW [Deltaproteobacteria bacterium]|nr:purine-binding chemotaxis protein CheW [Deltaproteobacteria bacterium]